MPSIISGDEKAQLSASYSHTKIVIDNVDSRGIWRKWEEHQWSQTLKLEGAHLISDRWQLGFNFPIVRRSRQEQKYSGIGDVSVNIAYEYLPDWDYNPIRPKGIVYFQITTPTGKSKFASEVGGLDSRGNGLWAIGLGNLLTKTFNSWDGFINFEVHRSFEKKIASSQINGTLKSELGGNAGLGGGYNSGPWRLGCSINWTYEDPIHIRGNTNLNGSPERYATAALAVSYLSNEEWAGTLSYADQTLFGSPINTSLGKTLSIQLQRKWGR